MRWRIVLKICLLALQIGLAAAQESGQICLAAFEDRSQNGQRDAGEPPITQGIGIHVLDSGGLTIQAKLLGDSPNAARGLVCMEGLAAGEYTLRLTSAEYAAAGASSFAARVVPGEAPPRFDFGVLPSASAADASAPPITDGQLRALEGIFWGLVGAGLLCGVMLLIGLLIYWRLFRRLPSAPAPSAPPQMVLAGAPPRPLVAAPPPKPLTAAEPASVPAATEPPPVVDSGVPLLFDDDDTERDTAV